MKRTFKMPGPSLQEMQAGAKDVYIYGYTLVLMDVTRRIHTAAPFPSSSRARLNPLAHVRFLRTASDTQIRHPHPDCLSSSAWKDLGRKPIVVSIPSALFNPALRMYWPKSDVLSGIWRPPAVMRTN